MRRSEVYRILDKKIEGFFPSRGFVHTDCFMTKDEQHDKYFSYHTRDTAWLAERMKIKLNIKSLGQAFFEEYITTSFAFAEARHEYEQKVVEWQIYALKNNLRETGDIIDSPNCDKKFRKKLVDSLIDI